jgi:hypothetical protein
MWANPPVKNVPTIRAQWGYLHPIVLDEHVDTVPPQWAESTIAYTIPIPYHNNCVLGLGAEQVPLDDPEPVIIIGSGNT